MKNPVLQGASHNPAPLVVQLAQFGAQASQVLVDVSPNYGLHFPESQNP
jgi:hypothetical protein